jgi:hypothetical protein
MTKPLADRFEEKFGDTGDNRADALIQVCADWLRTAETEIRVDEGARVAEYKDVVDRAVSLFSLIRYRGGIKNWGTMGMCEKYEVDEAIGKLAKLSDVLSFLAKENK